MRDTCGGEGRQRESTGRERGRASIPNTGRTLLHVLIRKFSQSASVWGGAAAG